MLDRAAASLAPSCGARPGIASTFPAAGRPARRSCRLALDPLEPASHGAEDSGSEGKMERYQPEESAVDFGLEAIDSRVHSGFEAIDSRAHFGFEVIDSRVHL